MSTIVAPTYATLSNGLRVVNFSSPHNFFFDDGTVLCSVEPQRTNCLKLEVQEDATWVDFPNGNRVAYCKISHVLTQEIHDELVRLQQDEDVDLIIVPRVLLDAVKEAGDTYENDTRKLVTVRLQDRVTKTNYHDRFCV